MNSPSSRRALKRKSGIALEGVARTREILHAARASANSEAESRERKRCRKLEKLSSGKLAGAIKIKLPGALSLSLSLSVSLSLASTPSGGSGRIFLPRFISPPSLALSLLLLQSFFLPLFIFPPFLFRFPRSSHSLLLSRDTALSFSLSLFLAPFASCF